MKRFIVFFMLGIVIFLPAGCIRCKKVIPETGTIQGTVVNQLTDQPVPGVMVSAEPAGRTVTTDADGEFSLAGISAGPQLLTASAPGYYSCELEINCEGDQAEIVQIALEPVTDACITGIVTDGRGGPAVAGVSIEYLGYTVATGPDGAFTLAVPAGLTADLLVEKVGFAGVRVQELTLVKEQVYYVEIPIRAVFNPLWTVEPPRVTVAGVNPGDRLSGNLDITYTAYGELDAALGWLTVNGQKILPELQNTQTCTVRLDSRCWPDGPGWIQITLYDVNNNSVILTLPVTIQNTSGDTAVPQEIPYIEAIAYTYGQNAGFYAEEELDMPAGQYWKARKLGPDAFAANASIYNQIYWEPAQGADGYSLYRSSDQVTWTKVGDVIAGAENMYLDYSGALAPLETMFYRVVPYNGAGFAKAASIEVTPLPALNVQLVNPADGATNVPLLPTLTWEYAFPLYGQSGIAYRTYLELYDSTAGESSKVLLKSDTTGYTLAEALKPGSVYTWDITQCYAFTAFIVTEQTVSAAYTFANRPEYAGSLNGKFAFTTTTGYVQTHDERNDY